VEPRGALKFVFGPRAPVVHARARAANSLREFSDTLEGTIGEKDRLAASSPHWTSPWKSLPQLLAILIAERIVVSAVSGAD
jgi:hypothetical protein